MKEGMQSRKNESRADGRKSRADGTFEEINSEKKKAEAEAESRAEQKQTEGGAEAESR